MDKEEKRGNFMTLTEGSEGAMMDLMQKPRSYDSNEHKWNEN